MEFVHIKFIFYIKLQSSSIFLAFFLFSQKFPPPGSGSTALEMRILVPVPMLEQKWTTHFLTFCIWSLLRKVIAEQQMLIMVISDLLDLDQPLVKKHNKIRSRDEIKICKILILIREIDFLAALYCHKVFGNR